MTSKDWTRIILTNDSANKSTVTLPEPESVSLVELGLLQGSIRPLCDRLQAAFGSSLIASPA